jgi:hypothetical protein
MPLHGVMGIRCGVFRRHGFEVEPVAFGEYHHGCLSTYGVLSGSDSCLGSLLTDDASLEHTLTSQ